MALLIYIKFLAILRFNFVILTLHIATLEDKAFYLSIKLFLRKISLLSKNFSKPKHCKCLQLISDYYFERAVTVLSMKTKGKYLYVFKNFKGTRK